MDVYPPSPESRDHKPAADRKAYPSSPPATDSPDSSPRSRTSVLDRTSLCGRSRRPVSRSDDKNDERDNSGASDGVRQAVNAIQQHFLGRLDPDFPRATFHLPQGKESYLALLDRLDAADEGKKLRAYLQEGRLRHDWDPYTGELVLYLMATDVHERFIAMFNLALEQQFGEIVAQYPALQPLRNQFAGLGHAYVKSSNKTGAWQRSPDIQFRAKGSRYPPLVVEVGYSQTDEQLERKAMDFFHERLNGQVRTVLCVDIEYKNKGVRKQGQHHQASLSLWTSQIISGDGDGEDKLAIRRRFRSRVFSDRDGRCPHEEAVLELPFEWFLSPGQMPPDLRHVSVKLPYLQLFDMIREGEIYQRDTDRSPTPQPKPLKRVLILEPGDDGYEDGHGEVDWDAVSGSAEDAENAEQDPEQPPTTPARSSRHKKPRTDASTASSERRITRSASRHGRETLD